MFGCWQFCCCCFCCCCCCAIEVGRATKRRKRTKRSPTCLRCQKMYDMQGRNNVSFHYVRCLLYATFLEISDTFVGNSHFGVSQSIGSHKIRYSSVNRIQDINSAFLSVMFPQTVMIKMRRTGMSTSNNKVFKLLSRSIILQCSLRFRFIFTH